MYFQASQDLSSFPCCNALFFNFRQILAYGSAEESMTDDKEFFILTSSSRQILTYGSAEESMTDDKEFFILTSSSRWVFCAFGFCCKECMTELTNKKELFILASNSALDFWPVEEGRTFPITIYISYINLQFQV
ncbi:hypothetical protein SUGI_0600270 [Cryptomeria japonica]|nr:hypothetical protein SUGI_0600270 [Cryptomeria japonica]